MKKLVMFSLALINTMTYSFATDYSLCSSFLEKATPKTYLSIDSSGKIKADSSAVDTYTASEDRKKFKLVKSWSDSKDPKLKEYAQVNANISEDGSISISHTYGSSYEKMQHLPSFGMNFNTVSIPSIQPIAQRSTLINLKIKNGKCYPEEVHVSNTLFPPQGQIGPPPSFIISANSKKCREILDFYKNNPSVKSCTNANSLKKLKKVLGTTSGSWQVNNKLLEDLDKKLSEANKLVELSTRELNKCHNFKLTEAVKDKGLWAKEQTNEGSATSSKSTEK